ncbi:MAG: neocarzinostatin apoprotein domain-containing protein [Acidimicrobiia bacterium]
MFLPALLVALALMGGTATATVGEADDGGSRSVASASSASRAPTDVERAAGVREVVVLAPTDDEFSDVVTVDAIDARVVLRVYAVGFEALVRGEIEQCVSTTNGVARCGNRFPVQFDENGNARFQYLVGDHYLDPGGRRPTCEPGVTSCVLRLTDGATTATVHLVFGDTAVRTRVTVTPRPDHLEPGQSVVVALTGFVPGERVRVTTCAAPATSGTRACGAPAPVAHVQVGADGTASTRLVVDDTRVGSTYRRCVRGGRCAIVVQGTATPATVPPIEVSFAAGAGASYDREQVALGFAAAFLLLVVAVFLIRRTDWRKPSEAETPEMDAAVLVDA